MTHYVRHVGREFFYRRVEVSRMRPELTPVRMYPLSRPLPSGKLNQDVHCAVRIYVEHASGVVDP